MNWRALMAGASAALLWTACSSDEDGGLDSSDAGVADVGTSTTTPDGGIMDGGGDGDPDAGVVEVDPFTTVRDQGLPAWRIDIAIVGDGYDASEIEDEYRSHVDKLVGASRSNPGMFGSANRSVTQPFRRYRSLFNMHRVNLISNESGIDAGEDRDTALDGTTECGPDICYVDADKVHAALDEAFAGTDIDPEIIVVFLNTEEKIAGTIEDPRGNIAVVPGDWSSDNFRVREIALREIAHAFFGVGYEFGGDGMYSGAEPDFPNLTSDMSGDKWMRWFGFDDPDADIGPIGVFEGGLGFDTGVYRPTEESKMGPHDERATFRFNGPSEEAIIRGIWDRLPMILQADPPNTETLVDPAFVSVFTPNQDLLNIEWYFDGMLVDGQDAVGFSVTIWAADNAVPPGTYQVRGRVSDPTSRVRGDRSDLEEEITWTVQLN